MLSTPSCAPSATSPTTPHQDRCRSLFNSQLTWRVTEVSGYYLVLNKYLGLLYRLGLQLLVALWSLMSETRSLLEGEAGGALTDWKKTGSCRLP